ncbi:MAG TPA: hypothetical protein VMS73_00110 [Anaerolineaceae bacterium]|nr:hypothetical protein [Anaerolineaceae bacterium]
MFNLVNVWILYSAGFAGLLVLKRKLKLSLVSFTILFLLFNFNGNILAHYSVGHTTWGGYFLFPWFVWLVFRLLEGDRSWLWTALMAILLFIIWLQGSFHQFVWLVILLAAIAIFIPKTFWTILKTGLITCLVCAFRILPAILAYGSYKQSFINGYPSLYSIWDALANVPNPLGNTFFIDNMLGGGFGDWELACFVGLLGAIFLIYYGIYRGLLHRQSPYRSLLIPLGIIFLLTLGSIFKLVIALPIPLIQGERVSSRMISVVLVFGIVLAAERFQRWLESAPQRPLSLAGCLFGLGIIGFDLWQDFTIWRVSNRPLIFWNFFNPANWTVKNQLSDSIYIWLVAGGLSVSVLTIVLLGILSWREHPEVHPAIKKAAVVLLHAFVGWGILAAILAFGRKDLAVSSVLIIQLIAAPILFAGIAWIYYSYFGVTTPLQTALFFMGVVMFMHVSVLVFFARNGVNLYLKPVTIWIAFGLVFVVTYLEGRIIQRRAIGKDALLHP